MFDNLFNTEQAISHHGIQKCFCIFSSNLKIPTVRLFNEGCVLIPQSKKVTLSKILIVKNLTFGK